MNSIVPIPDNRNKPEAKGPNLANIPDNGIIFLKKVNNPRKGFSNFVVKAPKANIVPLN